VVEVHFAAGAVSEGFVDGDARCHDVKVSLRRMRVFKL
jgi:hypothetical protein